MYPNLFSGNNWRNIAPIKNLTTHYWKHLTRSTTLVSCNFFVQCVVCRKNWKKYFAKAQKLSFFEISSEVQLRSKKQKKGPEISTRSTTFVSRTFSRSWYIYITLLSATFLSSYWMDQDQTWYTYFLYRSNLHLGVTAHKVQYKMRNFKKFIFEGIANFVLAVSQHILDGSGPKFTRSIPIWCHCAPEVCKFESLAGAEKAQKL